MNDNDDSFITLNNMWNRTVPRLLLLFFLAFSALAATMGLISFVSWILSSLLGVAMVDGG